MTAQAPSRPTYSPPKTYNFRQLEEIWVLAGGTLAEAPMAAAIALAESAGNPNAVNHNRNGSIDRGLWQINSVHGSLSSTDVAANARGAVKIYKESGWAPWVTFKTGAAQKQLTPARVKSGIPLEKPAEGQGIFSQSLEFSGAILEAFGFGAAANAGAKAIGKQAPSKTAAKQLREGEEAPEKVLEDAPGWLAGVLEFIGKEAITIVLLLAGAALVVYGIMVAVRPRQSAFSLPVPAIA